MMLVEKSLLQFSLLSLLLAVLFVATLVTLQFTLSLYAVALVNCVVVCVMRNPNSSTT